MDHRLKPFATFLLCTGARAGEALRLQWPDVDLTGARALFWEGETKSGARRVVQLPPAAVACLAALPHREGHVFRSLTGEPIKTASVVAKPWRSAAKGACLKGQVTPHTCRHTWATWHYGLHRDLLRLKAEGGWATTSMVERYAHLMPAGHEAEIRAQWGLPDHGHQVDTRSSRRATKRRLTA